MDAKQTITDRAFDEELNALVEKAIMSGVKPIVVTGCLQFTIMDVYAWDARNKAAVRAAKATETVQEAFAKTNSKIHSIFEASIAPAIKLAGAIDGTLVKAE